MQEYRRQIAYLYAYEQGMQTRMSGFVKAETRAGLSRLHIHLKAYCHLGEDTGKIYSYFSHQNKMIGIYLGELENRDGALQWQGMLDAENIEQKGISFAQTRGIWIRRSKERDYVAEWEDYPVDVSRFVLYPNGGMTCIRCPWFENCDGNGIEHGVDRRRKIYERGYSTST